MTSKLPRHRPTVGARPIRVRAAATAAVLVTLGLTACAKPAPVRRRGTEPDLRIGLAVGVSNLELAGNGGLAAVDAGSVVVRLSDGEEATLSPDGRTVVMTTPSGTSRHQRLSFVSLDPSGSVILGDTPYRGVIEVYARGTALTAVNELPIDVYLAGVVNAEMGRRGPDEQAALEAQAIVARTYSLRNRGKFGAEGFDLRGSVADQAYGGVTAETDAGRRAVQATAGLVLTYRGELATTFFHSTCGSSTAVPSEAFRSVRDRPYLRPVSDRHSSGYYCDISPRFRWTVEWEGENLQHILRRSVPAALGIDAEAVDQVQDVRVHRRGPSNRATELRLRVSRGDIPVFGPDIRSVLQTPDGRLLGSTVIDIAVEQHDGAVRRLTVDGRGWGHGVGMCQWGAVGRARRGQDAETIVTTYFPGTKLEYWY
jgi:stage II sporulation protein D